MPDVPEEGDHLAYVSHLEAEELLDLHGVDRGAWLAWVLFLDELAERTQLDKVEVLKLCPP